jgi:glycosyltransferase involved in cell wall biosynthesis
MRTEQAKLILKRAIRFSLGPLLPFVRQLRNWPVRFRTKRQAAFLHPASLPSVCYLTRSFPEQPATRKQIAHGGEVKMTFLAENFPHSYPNASLLYTVSSVDHQGKVEIIRQAKKNGLKIVLNQNGVAYPAWHGKGWEEANRKPSTVHELADFVIYQSDFCKRSALKFLGETNAPSVVLYNPVDLDLYRPRIRLAQGNGPILLLGGNQYEQYRFESAALAFQAVKRLLPKSSLIVTGKLWGDSQALAMEHARAFLRSLGVENQVEFTGQYTQQHAPKIFGRADILIHTKYNDPSPNLISEALAIGLPVVYSASGGTPELVGEEAGIGVTVEQGWETNAVPDPYQMANAVTQVWEKLEDYRNKARQRAEQAFSLTVYAQKHAEIFESLLQQEKT